MKLKLFAFFIFLFSLQAYAYLDEVTPSLERFSGYKPMYFLVGHPDTKVELSFKAQVVQAWPVYFAYTQLLMWEIARPDPFFRDVDYNPDLFYRFSKAGISERWLDLGAIEHESNGKGGAAERSWNRSYVRYQWTSKLGDSAKLLWSVKGWVPYSYNSSNRDIAKYRGLGELNVSLSNFLGAKWDRGDLNLRIYLGGKRYLNPIQGGQELTFRAKNTATKFLPLLVFQVFHGYGEDLLDYRQNRFGLRAGIGF